MKTTNRTTIELRTVTPEWATKKLEQMAKAVEDGVIRQRSLSRALVAKLTADIIAGHWVTNHQGIALAGPDEILIDGQHRLWAIKEAGKAVDMYVSTGWEIPADLNDGLWVVDSIDLGKVRGVPAILQIRGIANATSMAAYAAASCKVFAGAPRMPLSLPQTLDVLAIYKDAYEEIISIAGAAKKCPAYLTGPLAVYLHTYRRKGRELAKDFFFMENLKTGHPVLAWHKWREGQSKRRTDGSQQAYVNILRVCNAIWVYDMEDSLTDFKPSKEAREWLVNQDKAARSQMREILGMGRNGTVTPQPQPA